VNTCHGPVAAWLMSAALGLGGFTEGFAQSAGNQVTGGAHVESEQANAGLPSTGARRVYVQDFALGAATSTEQGTGHVGRPRLLSTLTGNDPATKAHDLVEQMSTSLISDLNKAGFPAGRLPAGGTLPTEGWLVRGIFTEADSGNTMRQAVIGFGAGASDMEVQVLVSDLAAANPAEAFLVLGTVSDPGHLPGGVVTKNPYMVAAKFVMGKNGAKHDAEHTAQAISEALVTVRKQVQSGEVRLAPTH
jgi:Domain of unknown function (DUF4410)